MSRPAAAGNKNTVTRLMRHLGPRLSLAGLSVVFSVGALVGLESVARWLSPDFLVRVRGIHVYSPDYGWTLRPGVSLILEGARTSVNDRGYRGRSVPAEKEQRRRAIVLGDSIAFGNGVPDGVPFAWQLDSRLRGPSVINLAVPGYGAAQELVKLEKEGLSYQPDVVILSFCQANDFGDTIAPRFLYDDVTPKPYCALDGDRLITHPVEISWLSGGLRRLGDHSHLLNRALAFGLSGALAPPTRADQQAERWRDRYRRLVGSDGYAQRVTCAAIHRMHQLSAGNGAAFLVAVFPDRRAYRQPAEKRMAAFNASTWLRGVKIIDMAEHFSVRGLAFEDIALDDIGHLTARGHGVAAEVLDAELRALIG